MASRYLTLEARTRRPRNEASRSLLDVVNGDGGFVLDTHTFGGLALSLTLELAPRAAATLAERLAAQGLVLDEADASRLGVAAAEEVDVVASLLVRFLADEPDLKTEIPKVPG